MSVLRLFLLRPGVECQIRLAAAVSWIHWQNKRNSERVLERKEPVLAPRVNNALFGGLAHGPRSRPQSGRRHVLR
jgi:hypothetical protein